MCVLSEFLQYLQNPISQKKSLRFQKRTFISRNTLPFSETHTLLFPETHRSVISFFRPNQIPFPNQNHSFLKRSFLYRNQILFITHFAWPIRNSLYYLIWDVLTKSSDSRRNCALNPRIIPPNIGGLTKSADSWQNAALNQRIAPPDIGGLNQIRGVMAEFHLGSTDKTTQYRMS